MNEEDCIDVLAKDHIAHLACAKDNRPYVVPVQYVFDPGNIYIVSMPGQKIDWLRANALACVQVQGMEEGGTWRSVVVEGPYEEFPDNEQWHTQRLRAWSLLEQRANWWEPGSLKPEPAAVASQQVVPVFFTILIGSVTGRQSSAGL